MQAKNISREKHILQKSQPYDEILGGTKINKCLYTPQHKYINTKLDRVLKDSVKSSTCERLLHDEYRAAESISTLESARQLKVSTQSVAICQISNTWYLIREHRKVIYKHNESVVLNSYIYLILLSFM